ncbi:hypothetical protein [Zobellia galactanivorans]|uniref:hypothetical protein n=1 Tax=Zobellia galactanivorans (strain DSM 12802 / CCUG 47099 / CIP 106680 / NCIMB 13871 / Dsij) TaxID=63186 RepID=UPI001C0727FD|nr:hypothetical protein [Zobellia galactanivorans]MBU3025089.1 hypothetical protein [Zobellia galactanivorans]
MKRKYYLKPILYAPPCITPSIFAKTSLEYRSFPQGLSFASDWQNWPNRNWIGSEFWGNRLQDWNRTGKAIVGSTSYAKEGPKVF